MDAILAGRIEAGDVVVIRYEGPKGGPGMKEMLAVTGAMKGVGRGADAALDHRRAVLRRHARLLRRPRRARGGRRRARSRSCEEGDRIVDRRRGAHDRPARRRRRCSSERRADVEAAGAAVHHAVSSRKYARLAQGAETRRDHQRLSSRARCPRSSRSSRRVALIAERALGRGSRPGRRARPLVPQARAHARGRTHRAPRPHAHRARAGAASSCSSTRASDRASGPRRCPGCCTSGCRAGADRRRGCRRPARVREQPRGRRAWHRFTVHFADGGPLALRDPRRLGAVELDPDEDRLGVDALELTLPQLRSIVARSRAPVKAVLMNQARIAGLGNLLVDEILWRAGHRARPPGFVTRRGRAGRAPPSDPELAPDPRSAWRLPHGRPHGRPPPGRLLPA